MATPEGRPFSRNSINIPLGENSSSASAGTCGTSDSCQYSPTPIRQPEQVPQNQRPIVPGK